MANEKRVSSFYTFSNRRENIPSTEKDSAFTRHSLQWWRRLYQLCTLTRHFITLSHRQDEMRSKWEESPLLCQFYSVLVICCVATKIRKIRQPQIYSNGAISQREKEWMGLLIGNRSDVMWGNALKERDRWRTTQIVYLTFQWTILSNQVPTAFYSPVV